MRPSRSSPTSNPRPAQPARAAGRRSRVAGEARPEPSRRSSKPAVVDPQAGPVVPPPAGRPLPLPHERDESTGQVNPQPQDVMQQAHRDIESGLVDTDLRATPGIDAETRERLLKKESRRR